MELHFTRTNGAADTAIDELIELVDGIEERGLVREMILAALKTGQENNDRAHMKLMNTTMKEMRFTGKIFSPYRTTRKVTVFGSARTRPEEPIYYMARQFGKKLVETGYMIITGAGGGIMQAANEGAGPEHSFGVNIMLPFEQAPNPVLVGNPRLITYRYFFNRKVAFLKEADAIALFPGGFGTLDEAMETLTLLQNGKHTPLPLLLIEEPGGTYWKRWVRFMKKELLAEGYISEGDFDLFECVDSVDTAVERINHFYSRYHSMRYVRGKLVFRLQSSISPADLVQLNKNFADILVYDGKIDLSNPLPQESDEPELSGLKRLVVDFNQKDFGRLRHLIDHINDI
ncbi:MAG TPA: TIGR00730 family Rossman fold protein [Nitrospirae bacterium]|nr:TIGR00730 family Rossman fold protein [Nitrospirota bacterium]HDZ83893.1 TIGR00730 family Rossman fold protein [Nitrospirota bacterium]